MSEDRKVAGMARADFYALVDLFMRWGNETMCKSFGEAEKCADVVAGMCKSGGSIHTDGPGKLGQLATDFCKEFEPIERASA